MTTTETPSIEPLATPCPCGHVAMVHDGSGGCLVSRCHCQADAVAVAAVGQYGIGYRHGYTTGFEEALQTLRTATAVDYTPRHRREVTA